MRVVLLLCCLSLAGCLSPYVEPWPSPQPPHVEPQPTPRAIAVLIVEEVSERTPKHAALMASTSVRDYLNTQCEKSPAGLPKWRIIDQDADLSRAEPWIKEAMALPRDSLPWIYISNGVRGTSGPLPSSEDDLLKLLRKWGGE